MEQTDTKNLPWWKKMAGVFKGGDANVQDSEQNSSTDEVELRKEAPPAPIEGDNAGSLTDEIPAKKALTRFQQHEIKMAQWDAEIQERRLCKAKEKNERRKKEEIRSRAAQKNNLKLIRKHRDALRLKKMQCRNTWGRLESEQWKSLLNEFIRSVLRAPAKDWQQWRTQINAIVGPADIKKTTVTSTVLGATFEFEVAGRLSNLGWNIQMLGKSGDQGGDILAQKKGKTVIIQCKNFGAKAGNGAVQEVAAGAKFYHATVAVVVAKNGFTKQAHALADKTSVLLLLPDQLTLLDNYV